MQGIYVFQVEGGNLSNPTLYSHYPFSPYDGIFSPDGAYFVAIDRGAMQAIVLSVTGNIFSNPVAYPLPLAPSSIAFSSDGSYLAIGVDNERQSFCEIVTFKFDGGRLENNQTYSTGTSSVNKLAFSPNGNYLAGVDPVGSNIIMYPFSNGALGSGQTYSLPKKSPYGLAFSRDGALLATADSSANDISVFKVGTILENPASYPMNVSVPVALAFSPNDAYLACVGAYGTVAMFNTTAWCSEDSWL